MHWAGAEDRRAALPESRPSKLCKIPIEAIHGRLGNNAVSLVVGAVQVGAGHESLEGQVGRDARAVAPRSLIEEDVVNGVQRMRT